MNKIVRRIIDISDDNNEKVLSETHKAYRDLPTAIFELEKSRKADMAMYNLILSKIRNHDYIFDDWHNNVFYMFRIGNICVECELIDALKKALDIYMINI